MHAISPSWRCSSSSAACRSPYGKDTVASVVSSGMPAFIGVVPMNQSSVEKKAWSAHLATSLRPVAARASRTAAVVASEPFLVNFTMSAVGTFSRNRSAASASMIDGRMKLLPFSSSPRTASRTRGWAWPRLTALSPAPYSTYSLPSTSQTWPPRPWEMTGAIPSGYWSEPLA